MSKKSFKIIANFYITLLLFLICIPTIALSKDFNKFSKVTFSINNISSETIIGYYENLTTNPKRAYAKFNLNGDICEGSVTIQNESSFKITCNTGYSAKGVYFPSSKSINAMGKGKDSKGNQFIFRIHGNGTATFNSFSKSLNSMVFVSKTKTYNPHDKKYEIKRKLLQDVSDTFVTGEDLNLKKYDDAVICIGATPNNALDDFQGKLRAKWDKDSVFYEEAKRRGLDCGVNKNKTFVEKEKKYKFKNQLKPSISSAELEAERKKRLELERELAEIKNKQKQEQQRINSDNQKPIINVFSKLNGSNAIVSGRITDNIEIAEVLVDGRVQKLKSNGTFETELYVPRSGLNVEIVAFDKKGNKATEKLRLERGAVAQASGPTFDRLNPSGKRVKSNPNALALIIGISNYSKTKADALYADKDAQQFYDYATMKLGIPARNVKELVNNKADRVEIGLAIQDWIARSTKQGKTDIYIFFAGHGLASQDGKDMFLLPYDGSPRLLKASAIRRKELFANIKQANPRSVTVFLDTCYSGVTRNEEMLIAGRPIVIKAKEQALPDGFTLFSAASNEQISRPLEEAKHGIFSYFLMKGMEGDADANNDNKITARELHAYVEQNVVQQSSGSQTPELQGNKDKVLVQFN